MVKDHDPMTNKTRGPIPLPSGDVPDDTQCITICIPTGSDYKRQLFGALYEFTHWNNYDRDETHKATLVAQAWRKAILEGMLNCYQWRVNGGIPQFSNDGGATWTNIPQTNSGDTGYDPRTDEPLAPARTGSNIRCLAAANAENCFYELHREIVNWYNDNAVAVVFLGAIALILGVFFPVSWAVFGLAASATVLAEIFLTHAALLNMAAYTTEIRELFVCLLYARAGEDGRWTQSAYEGVLSDMAEQEGSIWPLLIDYVENVAGYTGLNNAGTTTAITSYDCDTACTQWCFEFDFRTSQHDFDITSTPRGGWQATNGFYATYDTGPNERVWIERTFTDISIIEAEIDFSSDDNGKVDWYVDDTFIETDDTGSGTTLVEFAGARTIGKLSIRYDADNRSTTWIRAIRFRGLGTNPFGADNC